MPRRFAFVPNYTNFRVENGDVALVAELVSFDCGAWPEGAACPPALVGMYRSPTSVSPTHPQPQVDDSPSLKEGEEGSNRSSGTGLTARVVGRSTIVEHYVEEGTGGLRYCRVENLKDEEVHR